MTEPSKGGRELENDATLGAEGLSARGSRCRAPIHAEVIVAEAFWQRNRVLLGRQRLSGSRTRRNAA